MPLLKEVNAARMRGQREAERHEASELHKPDVAAPSQQRVRSKRIAEASSESVRSKRIVEASFTRSRA